MKVHWLGWLIAAILPVMLLSQERVVAQKPQLKTVPAGVYHSFSKMKRLIDNR